MNKPIPTRNKNVADESPFEGDFLNRSKLETRLTNYILRFQDGCVIGIDAPWGEGKTWFGLNWQKKLREAGHSTIWIDTFENDQSDDPFLTVTAEVWKTIDSNKVLSEKFLDRAKNVGMAILPIAGKAAISFAGRALTGMDLAKEYEKQISKASEELSKSTAKYLEDKIKEHDSQKKDVVAFRQSLKDLVNTLDGPLIIFIDELDRCRPDYAVKVVERIKHFFDVPHVVFVLLYHKQQLEEAVRGIYGQGIDANQYLGKFIHFSMRLSRKNGLDGISQNSNTKYCHILAEKHGFTNTQSMSEFSNELGAIAAWLKLSLRDLEKCYILYSLADSQDFFPFIAAWIIALKVKKPEIFSGVLENNRMAHVDALNILTAIGEVLAENWTLQVLSDLHRACAEGTTDNITDATKQCINIRMIPIIMRLCGEKFDLNVE